MTPKEIVDGRLNYLEQQVENLRNALMDALCLIANNTRETAISFHGTKAIKEDLRRRES